MYGGLNGWMDGGLNGWMDGWMDGGLNVDVSSPASQVWWGSISSASCFEQKLSIVGRDQVGERESFHSGDILTILSLEMSKIVESLSWFLILDLKPAWRRGSIASNDSKDMGAIKQFQHAKSSLWIVLQLQLAWMMGLKPRNCYESAIPAIIWNDLSWYHPEPCSRPLPKTLPNWGRIPAGGVGNLATSKTMLSSSMGLDLWLILLWLGNEFHGFMGVRVVSHGALGGMLSLLQMVQIMQFLPAHAYRSHKHLCAHL